MSDDSFYLLFRNFSFEKLTFLKENNFLLKNYDFILMFKNIDIKIIRLIGAKNFENNYVYFFNSLRDENSSH
jgi:hypothetical protein